jgi:hypothetical protein
MQNSEFRLEIAFDKDSATLRRLTKQGTTEERIPLTVPVTREGPGGRVFVASLPLREGFNTQYNIVDRWNGTSSSRVKQMTLSVLGMRQITTAFGSREVLEIEERPSDSTFRIVEYVRTTPPYYPFRMEYTRGAIHLTSEVVMMIYEAEGK